ncbi:hypothetical protein MW887_001794 [Aspergillus wentii]|nr:hypothetical protein MW887_001794 [Aspergillus wentii]
MGLQNNLAQDAAKDIANALPDLNGPHNTEQLFYDPLFDSDFALRELESAFDSRKRTGDEAFPTEFDIWGPPEKRRILELPPNQSNTTPPGETPSLSSPNSSLRPDPVETAPHTPAGMERSQTPNSLFDTADPLFEDATFSIPFDMNFENVEERSGFENFDADLSNAIDAIERDPIPATYSDIADELPSLSDFTKHRFDLDAHDIAASTSRDILQRVDQEPQYLSPYPRYRGPLGYLPSAPGIHVRCIEVAEDQVNYRIENFKRKVQQLTHERNKYKTAWTQWTTVDSKTGKTKEQLLREENASLRRVSSQHQRRVEEYKTEAESWKGQLHNLATLYNNLLYEIQVQQKIPTIAPAPPGYKPRPAPVNHNAQMQYPAPNQQPSIPGQAPQSQLSQLQNAPETRPRPQTAVPNQQPTVPGSQPQGPPTNPRAEPRSETVTIDLTDDDTNAAPDSVRSSPAPKSGGPELLQSFRNKKYGWLGNDGQSTGRQSVTGASPVSGQENSQASTNSPLHNTQSVDADSNGDPAIDNDLTRTMEDELARG